MKKFTLLGAIAAVGVLAVTSCGGNKEINDDTLPGVRVGLHLNLGAGAGYSAYNQGFMVEEGVNFTAVTGDGPSLATQVIAGQIDVSFMGGGVAWNYFTEDSKVKIVALDNLTDDDRLIAKLDGKGKDLTINSTLEEIGAALKGSTVAFDQTATPASFWTSLVNAVNAKLEEGQRIWYQSGEDRLPNNLTDADYVAANQVTIVNATNVNISTSAQTADWDFVIAFAPVATQLEENTKVFKTVCKTSTHMSDSYAPSTWAVNTDWLAKNEETFKKFMKALVRGMNFRHDNPAETCKDIESVTVGQVAASSLNTDIAVWLNAEQQLELDEKGDMMKYVENIRNGQLAGNNASKISKEAKDVVDFSYLLEACEDLA